MLDRLKVTGYRGMRIRKIHPLLNNLKKNKKNAYIRIPLPGLSGNL